MSKSISLVKKLRLTAAAGALPATTIAAIGDFFSPVGGWLLPLLMGGLALLAAMMLLLIGTSRAKKISDSEEDMHGWWEGPRHSQLGVWVLMAIAISGLVFGSVSYSRTKQDGNGWMANRVPAIADAQRQLGLLEESIRLQTLTADATETIRDEMVSGRSNPRKELSDRGIDWKQQNLRDAIAQQDHETVELFLLAGMGFPVEWALSALAAGHDDIVKLIYAFPERVQPDARACLSYASANMYTRSKNNRETGVRPFSAAEKEFFRKFCSGHAEVSHVTDELEGTRATYARQKNSYDEQLAQYVALRKSEIRSVAQCRESLLAADGYIFRSLIYSGETVDVAMGRVDEPTLEMIRKARKLIDTTYPAQPTYGFAYPIGPMVPFIDEYCAEKKKLAEASYESAPSYAPNVEVDYFKHRLTLLQQILDAID